MVSIQVEPGDVGVDRGVHGCANPAHGLAWNQCRVANQGRVQEHDLGSHANCKSVRPVTRQQRLGPRGFARPELLPHSFCHRAPVPEVLGARLAGAAERARAVPGGPWVRMEQGRPRGSQLSSIAAYIPTSCPTTEKQGWLGDALFVR